MIAATRIHAVSDESEARAAVDAYLRGHLGLAYRAGQSYIRNGERCFIVNYHCQTIGRVPSVGVITVNLNTGQINELTNDQIRNLFEAGAVQAAQARGERARDKQGYVLRYHARIKATVWISDHVDLKVGASGGVLIPLNPPIWRFSIDFTLDDYHLEPLGVIDVNAQTGDVLPLTDKQLLALRRCVRAAKRLPALATAA